MWVYTPLRPHRILHAAIPSNMPSPGRQQPGNHVGSLRLLSSQLQIQPIKKGKQCYLVFLPGFYFSLTLLISVPVLVFAAVRQSMQNMPSYSSTLSLLHLCFQLLNCFNFYSYTLALDKKKKKGYPFFITWLEAKILIHRREIWLLKRSFCRFQWLGTGNFI